jgi:two-component system sensor histidine kinase PilS (NtrC family)
MRFPMATVHDPAHPPAPALTSNTAFLSRAIAQGLDTPLAALRASLETLGQELRQSGTRLQPMRIEGVLGEFERLGRNVRNLLEYATPPVVHALECSLEEIVHAARAPLAPELRERVVSARIEPGAALLVDGPLLAICLRRLLENALEAGTGPVLVVARREDTRTSFSVLDEAGSDAFGPAWQPTPFLTTKPNHIGLGLALTQRDVALLGGQLEFLRNAGGETCVRITFETTERVR